MRRLLLLVLLVASVPVLSQTIEHFGVVVEIHADGFVSVSEQISVRFDTARHGIFREIPLQYRLPTGESYRLRVELGGVLANGEPVPVRRTTEQGYLVLRLGDPDRLVRGTVTYTIEYRLQRALRQYGDEVELYWNAIGHEWEMPIEEASVEVRVPAEVSPNDVRTTAFIGPPGSRAPFELGWEDGTLTGVTEGLRPSEGITIGVRIPAESVQLPGGWQALVWFLADNVYAAFPLLTLLGMTGLWLYRGRSPERGTISPVFVRPKDLGPAEAGTLVDDRVDTRDITAGIVDLAVKGHLRIHEIWEDDRGKEPQDFELERLQGEQAATAFEQALMDALLQGAERKKLSELRYKLYDKLPGLSTRLYKDLSRRKYYDGNPDRVRNGYRTLGVLGLAGGVAAGVLTSSLYLGASLAVSGLVVVAFARIMPRKTHRGMEVLREVLGLEEYIARAEVDRMEFAAAERHFEELLPYAIALDLTEVWANKFDGLLQQPPGWYDGRFPTFAPYWLGFRLGALQRSAHRAATTAPRQTSGGWRGGSAFGGGGFSGGGMGGGGGRAW